MYKKKNLLPVISLVCAVIALILSVIAILPGGPGPDQSYENPALEQQVQALQAQVDALTAQLEGGAVNGGLTDWNLSAAAWAEGDGADVTLTALPAVFEDGMRVIFSVLLDGQEAASQTCTLEDNAFSATVSLPAADGYGYYCILVSPDGTRQQVSLTTPENPADEYLVYLQSSLDAYCIMTIGDWSHRDMETLVLASAQIEVQLPLIGSGDDTAVSASELVLSHNGEEITRIPLDPTLTRMDNAYILEITDISFPIPGMAENDSLELTLEVVLSDGKTLSTPGASWYLTSGELYMVVG